MKRSIILASLIVFLFSLQAVADDFAYIVAFGDSLSDNGNTKALLGTQPTQVETNYWEGRFSNGPVWIEHLSENLDATLINNAYGGAKTGHGALFPYVPGVLTQIETYGEIPENSLVVVNGGANDFLGGATDQDIPTMIGNIMNGLANLVDKGAENILVLGMPDLGITPLFNQQPWAEQVSLLSAYYNMAMSNAVAQFNSDFPATNVYYFDTLATANYVIQNAEGYSLVDTINACPNAFIQEPIDMDGKHFFFWDAVHPTTDVHDILADHVERFLDAL